MRLSSVFLFVGSLLLPSVILADQFEVTIRNLTRGQQFTPILVASHRGNSRVFTLGGVASSEIKTLAEEGNTAPLSAVLSANSDVRQVVTGAGLLPPGGSVTLIVKTEKGFDYLTVAAMLIPTNDAFFAVNGVFVPKGNRVISDFYAPAYDAGTERNDELCASIPGPNFAECGGPGGGGKPSGGEEGFVHIHAGIHGVGDLKPSVQDWRNPVALISVRRVPE